MVALTVGDGAPLFALRDQFGKGVVLRDLAGAPTVLVFYPKSQVPMAQDLLRSFQAQASVFSQRGINLLAIGLDSPEEQATLIQQYGITFPLLQDSSAQVSLGYGVCEKTSTAINYVCMTFLLDLNLRVAKFYCPKEMDRHPAQVLEDIQQLFPTQEAKQVPVYAPVLYVPNVLSQELCEELIHVWRTEGNVDSGVTRKRGQETYVTLDYGHKRRRDHYLEDPGRVERVDAMFHRRLVPEIKKAFSFEVTRHEDLRIVCYDAEEGGYFKPHRDNTTLGTAHRRFAMTLNLNEGAYEGGYLKFPEYGSHLYKPKTGDAIIFSCGLLHEATPVTQGERFVLLSFLYGEEDAKRREAYEQSRGGVYRSDRTLEQTALALTGATA